MTIADEVLKALDKIEERKYDRFRKSNAQPTGTLWASFADLFDVGILDIDNMAVEVGYEDFEDKASIRSRITQRIPSVSGREEYIRVKLREKNGELWAEPVPGGSSVISSLSKSDGLVRIGLESEGIEKGEEVEVLFM